MPVSIPIVSPFLPLQSVGSFGLQILATVLLLLLLFLLFVTNSKYIQTLLKKNAPHEE